ncbi:hypothetical protein [Muricoccus radiodurans]|uniref:hypothetical protein n=1 Tax=Muricoccus radiodurans TaxID=2231721 RepID=UPI003CF6F88A
MSPRALSGPAPRPADIIRLGTREAQRLSALLALPGQTLARYPGDGGRVLPTGGGPSVRVPEGRSAPVWRSDSR